MYIGFRQPRETSLYMSVYQSQRTPLEFQINSKVSETDYLALREISRNKKLTQAALIRSVIKEYLSQQKLADPPVPLQAEGQSDAPSQ